MIAFSAKVCYDICNNTIPGGIIVAKRNRYREMEQFMTKILLGDAAAFVLYLLFAGLGVGFLKGLMAIIAIAASGLSLGFLYLNGELKKRRSRWMVMGYGAIVVCLLVSLLLNYPSPKKVTATPAGSSVSSEVQEDPAEIPEEDPLADTSGVG